MPGQWVVLVEATDGGTRGDVDQHDVVRLLTALDRNCGGTSGGALHSSDRYALQVTTTASDPAEALCSVLSGWADALRDLDLPVWEVVRTEVLTPDELERDQRNHLRGEQSVDSTAGPRSQRHGCGRRRAAPPRLL